MKKFAFLLLAFLQSCSPDSSPLQNKTGQTETGGSLLNEEQKTAFDGTYNYSSIVCRDGISGSYKATIQNRTYELITISNGQFYAKIGYVGTDSTFFNVYGSVTNTETTISLSNLTVTNSTHPDWQNAVGYRSGVLNYPSISSYFQFNVGMNLANVSYNDITVDQNRDLFVALPPGSASAFGGLASDNCFLYYDRLD